ncbi:type II secretion system protein N [Ramlibacter sp. PS4R-6]|uniref:type II secretion system protein N n=1 Tax=Ramlibacter sp. PS4R-6 TaxID=3133438 RepID=UPI0030AB9466
MAAPAPLAPLRNPWPWAAAGIVLGLVLAVLLFLPASWLAARVAGATEGRVQLADAQGSLWNGSATLLLTGGTGSNDSLALPTPVEWRIRPRWNGAAIELATACCTREPVALRVHAGWRRVEVDVADGRSQWPAALLAGLGTPWNTLQLDGDLQLATQGLSVEWAEGRLALAGRAELVAQRMASRLSTLRPMGSYRMTVSGGATPNLQLETLDGALQLSGTGQWVGSRLHFNGVATAAPGREEALANLLNIIGRRNGARSIISIG